MPLHEILREQPYRSAPHLPPKPCIVLQSSANVVTLASSTRPYFMLHASALRSIARLGGLFPVWNLLGYVDVSTASGLISFGASAQTLHRHASSSSFSVCWTQTRRPRPQQGQQRLESAWLHQAGGTTMQCHCTQNPATHTCRCSCSRRKRRISLRCALLSATACWASSAASSSSSGKTNCWFSASALSPPRMGLRAPDVRLREKFSGADTAAMPLNTVLTAPSPFCQYSVLLHVQLGKPT